MSIAIKNNIRDPYVHSANYSLCIFCSQLLFLSSTGQSLLLTPFTFSHTDTAQPAGHWRIIIKKNYRDHYVQSRNYSLCVFCSQLWNLSSNGLTPLPTSVTFNSTDTSQPAGHWPPMDPQVPSCMKLLAYRHPLSRPIQSLSRVQLVLRALADSSASASALFLARNSARRYSCPCVSANLL